ncbi:MAG: hypothetical protein LUQ37_09755 [Methanoregulaceae archaeon]|jgi:hypothetical protein|nr:hypothetical protein [Methanoregulaceae archaeon]
MVLDSTHHQLISALFQIAVKLFFGFRAGVIDIPDYQYRQTGPLQLAYLDEAENLLAQAAFIRIGEIFP